MNNSPEEKWVGDLKYWLFCSYVILDKKATDQL